jgi:hypothetical protein
VRGTLRQINCFWFRLWRSIRDKKGVDKLPSKLHNRPLGIAFVRRRQARGWLDTDRGLIIIVTVMLEVLPIAVPRELSRKPSQDPKGRK